VKLCKGCQQKRPYTDYAKSGLGKCRACRVKQERLARWRRKDESVCDM